MTEPGSTASVLVRLSISIYSEDEARLNKLKHQLEVEAGKRLSTSEVFRRAIDCLSAAKGL